MITSLNDGGAESVLYRLVTQDRQNEHHVVSLTGMGKYGPSLQQSGIVVTALGMPRGQLTLRGLWELRRVIVAFQPDVVHTWMYHTDFLGELAARLASVSAVGWCIRNRNLDKDKQNFRPVQSWSVRIDFEMGALTYSFVFREGTASSCGVGLCIEKIVVVPNGFDLSQFKPDLVS